MIPTVVRKPIEDAVRELLNPAARRIGAGLLALVDAAHRGQAKSAEELLIDTVEGQIAASDRRFAAVARLREIACDPDLEHQRILARAAAEQVPFDRFIVPALSIAGRVFRESEFDEPGSPIWEMWVQLLARACDKDRVSQAHPSFPWIITQLSSDEAKLLGALSIVNPRTCPPHLLEREPIPYFRSSDIGVMFEDNLSFYLGHIQSLGLTIVPVGFEPTAHVVFINSIRTYMLTDFGRTFISAVKSPS